MTVAFADVNSIANHSTLKPTMATTIPHDAVQTPSGSKISIKSWHIESKTLPISNAAEITYIQDTLNGLPLPEMPFGNNSIVIRNEEKSWEYTLNTLEALRLVKLGSMEVGDGGVQVGHAKAWLESR